ncbi:hypothetical protein BLL42_28100 (plasmid) [Pseudomonas frederiksbergensis]|uniref:Uncharacterized protein n=1 Tax=Pseudomonas frederiksbergensis TaxID=104087 RepID=A0A1J0ETW1_9PSED|nr:hypothetical protein BLL42_28100 [Pseudomonas frederiksbergensis]
MDVIAPLLNLLDAADVFGQMVKDRIALNFSGQPILISKCLLDTQPSLHHREVTQVDSDHHGM